MTAVQGVIGFGLWILTLAWPVLVVSSLVTNPKPRTEMRTREKLLIAVSVMLVVGWWLLKMTVG